MGSVRLAGHVNPYFHGIPGAQVMPTGAFVLYFKLFKMSNLDLIFKLASAIDMVLD